jgi:hypothetical protein
MVGQAGGGPQEASEEISLNMEKGDGGKAGASQVVVSPTVLYKGFYVEHVCRPDYTGPVSTLGQNLLCPGSQ